MNACDDARPLGAVASGALFEEPAGKTPDNSKSQKSAKQACNVAKKCDDDTAMKNSKTNKTVLHYVEHLVAYGSQNHEWESYRGFYVTRADALAEHHNPATHQATSAHELEQTHDDDLPTLYFSRDGVLCRLRAMLVGSARPKLRARLLELIENNNAAELARTNWLLTPIPTGLKT